MQVFAYNQQFIEKWQRYERMYVHAPGQVSDLMENSLEEFFGWVPDSVKVEADCVIAEF